MPTEREVLLQILEGKPEGVAHLMERHGALFHEGLIRFLGRADSDQGDRLAEMMRIMVEDLKNDRFNDLQETFYDWVVRNSWCTLMKWAMEEAGEEVLDPEIIYAFADPLCEAALPPEVRVQYRARFDEYAFYRDLLDKCKDIPVEVRHAGANYPEEFNEVIQKALAIIQG
jgi:hypothetical protein